MRILILTQIYLPEMGALSNRLYPIVNRLAAAGHQVTVATGMPNYPGGKVFPKYRRKMFTREHTKAAEVIRTAYYTVPRNRSKISQLLSYLSFMPAVLISALRAGKADVVFVTTPPTFPVLPAVLVARLRGARLVLDVRDIWSDELVSYSDTGAKSMAVRTARALEKFSYRTADLICCTTNSLVKMVIDRGASEETTHYFPNGADLDLFKPLERKNPAAESFGFGDRFVVMYSGLFGIKHGLEVLLQSAADLREEKDIVFFLVGNGARREALDGFVRDNRLDNVIITDERPVEEIPHLLARADACFAACRPEPYPKSLISVKVFEYMACEKPVVGAFEGETAQVISESGGGIVVPPGDPKGITAAILKLRADKDLRRSMGEAGRRYVEKNFSRNDWADRFGRTVANIYDESVPADLPYAVSGDVKV